MLGPPSSGLWSAGHNVRGLCSFSPAPLQVTEPPVSPKLARAAASPRPAAGRGEGHLRSRLCPWGHRCPSVSTSLSLMWLEPLSFLLTPVPCLRGWETAPDTSLCRIYILGISLFRPTPPRPALRRDGETLAPSAGTEIREQVSPEDRALSECEPRNPPSPKPAPLRSQAASLLRGLHTPWTVLRFSSTNAPNCGESYVAWAPVLPTSTCAVRRWRFSCSFSCSVACSRPAGAASMAEDG